MTETYLDRGAPYGANGYAFGRGEDMREEFTRKIIFPLRSGSTTLSVGVGELPDGTVYLLAVRREGHGDVGHDGRRFLADRVRHGTFADVARGSLLMHQNDMEPDAFAEHLRAVDAL